MNARSLFLLALAGFTSGVLSQNIVIDDFKSQDANTRGNWHGCDGGAGITCTWGGDGLTITSSDTDFSFYSQFDNGGCQDVSGWDNQFVHIQFSGSADFSIAMQQNNAQCNTELAPYPETWDIVYAADYSDGSDIFIPVQHFNIIKSRAVGLAFKAFRNPNAQTKLSLIEIVAQLPSGRSVPQKKPTGPLYFSCTRPNSIAFGIDDGSPEFAQEIMSIIDQEQIKVTFFVVGQALDDPTQNFTAVYRDAIQKGHQVALHSYTHPKIESLLDINAINSEFQLSRESTLRNLGVDSKYFRAPYGTDGALTRQRLEANVPGAKVINWSIDIEDWLWAESATPEKQTDAVIRDLAKGGNLFVAHYLYRSTVDQFRTFIQLAKGTGKTVMRVDQCLGDPAAPPL
ncbi:glycoside hydrolase/deacetylase [Choiromyces venosus 120613-1]|uniref:Glycoside hydrolase/deacetylase n=1 Tax=Choiromyces venosus 120613-1 TaxID=1336337 RepID=A0A3N4IW72_9PEZI|nr:glycoside hydrolase/deacetylase [Choiromyces venosus 120613-1]